MAGTEATGSGFADKRMAEDFSNRTGAAPRFLDWIWHIKGSVPLLPGQSGDEAFEKLDPLFQERGTTYDRQQEALVFSKKDPDSQDKMSIFDNGVLWIENGVDGAVLCYHLTSKALLACFLAPLLFLAFAQIGIAVDGFQSSSTEEADSRSREAAGAAEEAAEEEEDEQPLHWIDQALGAPTAEKADKSDEGEEEEDEGFSPTPAYVFAGLFAVLYAVGRVLEDRLIQAQFRKRLRGIAPASPPAQP